MSYDLSPLVKGYTNDEEVRMLFREKIGAYLGCPSVIPVTNGTHALEVALRGAGLERGEAVLIPDISFIATATAVANSGLIPVYADVSKEYYGLTLKALKERYSSEIKAVIVVHFSGFVNREIFEIRDFCRERKLVLIEDCAQSFCCSAKGIRTGALGDLGTFSFQSSKIVNAGEGGLVSATDADRGAECEAIADWGMSHLFPVRRLDLASSNFRLSAIQCFILSLQVDGIAEIARAREKRCLELAEACRKLGLEPAFPSAKEGYVDSPFFFTIKSRRNINLVEPRDESPMHKSRMVASILERFHPDLTKTYRKLNPTGITAEYASNRIIEETDFINISQTAHLEPEQVFASYL